MMPALNPELFATFLVAARSSSPRLGRDSLNTLAIGMSRHREAVAYAPGVGIGCMTHTLWAVFGVARAGGGVRLFNPSAGRRATCCGSACRALREWRGRAAAPGSATAAGAPTSRRRLLEAC